MLNRLFLTNTLNSLDLIENQVYKLLLLVLSSFNITSTIKQNKSIIKFNYEMNKNMLTFLFNLVIFKPLKDLNGISQ